MSAGPAVAAAVTFLWLGMVLAISFLEAPLKFRAPGVTLPIGLGIGRLVFRGLNATEAGLAMAILVAMIAGPPSRAAIIAYVISAVVLLAQLLAVRPRLTHRSNAVLAGADAPRSHAHHAYAALELVKVVALVACGVLLLAGG